MGADSLKIFLSYVKRFIQTKTNKFAAFTIVLYNEL
jgi:hypothetical protein